jgi:hypothetical protein
VVGVSAEAGEIRRQGGHLDDLRAVGYLETDRPGNVAFYTKFGFQVTGTALIQGFPRTSRGAAREAPEPANPRRCSRAGYSVVSPGDSCVPTWIVSLRRGDPLWFVKPVRHRG